MNERIRHLLDEMSALEDELRAALHEQESRIHFRIEGKRIEFKEAVRKRHRQLRTGLMRWLRESEVRNFVSAPFIYAMILPFAILDIGVSLYQLICFPLYRIRKVRRADYIVMDRFQLSYLNILERLNCVYCAYANGLLAYVREIAARTEQYWCPVKHARKVLGTHARYARFADFGDAENYQEELANLRSALISEAGPAAD